MSDPPPASHPPGNDRDTFSGYDAQPVILDPNAHIPRTIEPEQRPPRLSLWILHLFFRPKHFFTHFPKMATNFTVFYAAWAAGIMQVISEVNDSEATSGVGQTGRYDDILSSWSAYWAFCFGVGLFCAALIWKIGGWWYRKRLRFCGYTGSDKSLTRRVYIFATFIYAFPSIILMGLGTIQYASPSEFLAYGGSSWAIWYVFLFWSIYTSYRGVRTIFQVRLWASRFWFAILPAAFFGCFVVAGIVMQVVAAAEPPDLANWRTIDRPGFRFRYPANWSPDHDDKDQVYWIQSTQDALAWFCVRNEPGDPGEETAAMLEQEKETFESVGPESVATWAGFEGEGVEFVGVYQGYSYRVCIFSATSSTRSFTVVERVNRDDEDIVEPGFQMIRDSFVLKD